MEQFPNEIFRIIFQLSVLSDPRPTGFNGLADADGSEGQTWPSVFHSSKGPWAISRVNRQWRAISTAFPQLWSRFSVMVGSLDPTIDGGASTTALSTWLSFSGTVDLSFLIDPNGICNDPNHSAVFELLIDRADRWKKIEFYNSASAFWSMLHTGGVRSRLGSLESIAILASNTGNVVLPDDPAHYQIFLDAPRLQTLIHRDHLPVMALDLPWTQLREFEGSHRSNVEDHLQFLRRTTNLESCRLTFASVMVPQGAFHPQTQQPGSSQTNVDDDPALLILLPHLQTFQIRTTWFSDSIQNLSHLVVRRLRFPALKTLRIVSEHLSPIAPPLGAFADVIHLSRCELHTLEVSSRGVSGVEHLRSSEDVLELLRATPSLRYLCITVGTSKDSRILQDTILPRLDLEGRRSEADEVLVPVLEVLELRFPSPSAIRVIDFTALAMAVRSRLTTASGGSIRKLHFIVESGNGHPDDVLTLTIRALIMEVLQGEQVDVVIETRYAAKKD